MRIVILSHFGLICRNLGDTFRSKGLKSICQAPRNQPEVCQNYDPRKAVSATVLVLKWSGAIFRPRSSKVSVPKTLQCRFLCKPRPSRVYWESPGVENIPQLPVNRAEASQNHDSRKVVSATLSGLKWSGAIFRPRSLKVSVQKVLLFSSYCKPRQ